MGEGMLLMTRPTRSLLWTVKTEGLVVHPDPKLPAAGPVKAVMGMVGGRPTVAVAVMGLVGGRPVAADLSASCSGRRARIDPAEAPEEAAVTSEEHPLARGI